MTLMVNSKKQTESTKVSVGQGQGTCSAAQLCLRQIKDDNAKVHKDCLPNSYYVPNTKGWLLSPQHWSRELWKQGKKGAHSIIDCDRITLNWPDAGSKKTVLLDPITNVGTFWTAPGYSKVTAFCAEATFNSRDEAKSLMTDKSREGNYWIWWCWYEQKFRGSWQGNLRLRGSYSNTSK
jgi:hypothetical protein